MTRRSVSFKAQHADSDCGAACLAMILAYYGQDMSVFTARRLCEQHGAPESTRAIIGAARERGMQAHLLASDLDALPQVELPCILFWRFSHFVVLTRITAKGYEICDPALGKRVVSAEEFALCYTGIAVAMAPGPDFRPQSRERNPRLRLFIADAFRSAGGGKLLGLLLLLSLALQGLSLLLPFASIYIIDVLIPASLSEAMLPLLGLVLLLGANTIFLSYARARLIVALQQAVDMALLKQYLTHLLSLPLRFFHERTTAEVISRMNSNSVIRDVLSNQTLAGFLDLLAATVYLGVLAFAAPMFAMLTLAVGVAHLAVNAVSMRSLGDRISAELRTQTNYQSFATETVNGIATIKCAAAEPQVELQWAARLEDYQTAARNRSLVDARKNAVLSALRLLSPVLLFWFGCVLYFNGQLSLGEVVAANSIAAMALVPLAALMTNVRQLQLLRTHAERLGDTWMHEPETRGHRPCPSLRERGSLRLSDVSFRYTSARENALTGVGLEIPFGGTVGIIGPSGSGKSTLLSILLGLHRPDNGTVELNGVPLAEIDSTDYRRRVAFVAQDSFVFGGSIRANVSLGQPELPVSEVMAALEAAGLSETVEAMPMGIETRVGELGARLSGGQRQRIAIARALARRPELLILDEATSNLDGLTEATVSDNIERLDVTRVIVSHRLSTVANCDLIYVLDRGRIVAHGTPRELAAQDGFYRTCLEAGRVSEDTDGEHTAAAEVTA